MATRSAADLAAPISDSDHTQGPSEAAVSVVEYGDFQCPTCKLAFPTVKMLLKHFGPRVRFAYRHFPLEQPHPLALAAAEAAESAHAQGKFWEMHDILFERQPRLERIHLEEYAQALQLDVARFVADLDAHAHVRKVRADIESGTASRLRGTPGFYVNGRIVDVSFGMHALLDSIETAMDQGPT